MKMTSCSVCFAVLPVKETMVFEHRRICRKCRSKQ
ncbi:hypothetical protein J2S16_002949 [Cytobacillus kochii]|nr:hypothetical protein [Cytobacillus kochii]